MHIKRHCYWPCFVYTPSVLGVCHTTSFTTLVMTINSLLDYCLGFKKDVNPIFLQLLSQCSLQFIPPSMFILRTNDCLNKFLVSSHLFIVKLHLYVKINLDWLSWYKVNILVWQWSTLLLRMGCKYLMRIHEIN